MGHWCWICGRVLPNERFSGKGHSRHICKECSKLPHQEIQKKRDTKFLYRLFKQNRISEKNIKMLETMCKKYTGELQKQAEAVLQLAQIRPYKKKRLGYIYHNHRELFDQLVNLRLIEDWITPLIEAEEAVEAYYDSFELEEINDEDEFEEGGRSEEYLSEDELDSDDDYDLPF